MKKCCINAEWANERKDRAVCTEEEGEALSSVGIVGIACREGLAQFTANEGEGLLFGGYKALLKKETVDNKACNDNFKNCL